MLDPVVLKQQSIYREESPLGQFSVAVQIQNWIIIKNMEKEEHVMNKLLSNSQYQLSMFAHNVH